MLTVVIFFLLISMTVVLGIANPILKQVKISQENYSSKKSYYLAEGALEDAYYRLISAKTLGSTEVLTLNGGTATTAITTTATGKQFVATASVNNAVRKVQAVFALGTGISFHYGVQSGQGGFVLSNSSSVIGNIYSGGSVIGSGGNMVYGDVISAGAAGLVYGIHSTSSVYAHTIGNGGGGTTIDKDAYYQTITNTTVAGTRYGSSTDQATTSLPISDDQISEWESDATAGGTMLTSDCGSYSSGTCVITSNKTLGPLKIPFNLSISGSPTVTITGPLWITGNITISNSPTIKIATSLGTQNVAIIADNPSNPTGSGIIDVNNSATFSGSGSPGSFVFLVSQNTSAENGGAIEAISLSQGAAALVVYASHGLIALSNSINLKEVTAYKTTLKNSAKVTYDTGLPSTVFAAGPSGGYDVVSWGEI
ncbi:MAG: hypothetical protein JWO73_367 [Candidatus Taylorbacteria bacterium]|nr:hypothetical protein [Candidatus Taylorbacteria bacterium]